MSEKINPCKWSPCESTFFNNDGTPKGDMFITYEYPTPPPNKKLDGDMYEGVKNQPPTPNYKDIQGEPREGISKEQNQILKEWQRVQYKNNWDRKLYRKINIIIYKNKETLNHAIIFLSIVFGLKMIELDWSVIKMFCIENQNYFYLAWSLFAVLYINRGVHVNQKNKQEKERINKWLEDNL